MSDPKQQWKKRVEVFKCIYSELISDHQTNIQKTAFLHYSFDKTQMEIIEFYSKNKIDIIKLIAKNLDNSWSWERIPVVEQAILISAYCESKVSKINKAIIIDQSLVTLARYGNPDSKKYVNAILEKVIE